MTADIPVVEVRRVMSRRIADRPLWLVRRCPFCGRRHVHPADLVMTSLIVGAPCNRSKFYRLEDVDAQQAVQ